MVRQLIVSLDLADEVIDIIRDHNGGNDPTDDMLRRFVDSSVNGWGRAHSECEGDYCEALQEMMAGRW